MSEDVSRKTEAQAWAPGLGGLSPEKGTQGQEIIAWQKETWGRWGQHSNIYSFILDLEQRTQIPIFQTGLTVRYVNHDSRKNFHRRTYVALSEITSKLQGKVLKYVEDSATSSRREIQVSYYLIGPQDLILLPSQKGLRDDQGFFDLVQLPSGQQLKVRKDAFEVVSA